MASVVVLFSPVVAVFVSMGIGSKDAGFVGWLAAGVAAFLCALIVFLIFRKRQVFVPDPPPPIVLSEDEINANAEAQAKWERIEAAWWYRYPMAGLAFLSAWFLMEWRPNLWWLSVIAVLYGLTIARELGAVVLYVALAGFGIYIVVAAFQGVASLPVSVAIIIGAVIIAAAVGKRS